MNTSIRNRDNNLTGLSSAAGTVGYTYDALGRRVSRTDASGLTHSFVFDGSRLVAEYNDTSQVWDTEYTYGYDMLDKQGAGGTEYPLYNGQGDVYQSLTPSGSYVLSAHILDDFGQGFTAASGTDDLAYKWRASSGYRNDGDGLWTGSYNEPLVKVGARYYIPAMGVFITRDTDLGQRPYEYCDADPVNNVDPSGHQPKFFYRKNKDGSTTVTVVDTDANGNPYSWSYTIPPPTSSSSTPPPPSPGPPIIIYAPNNNGNINVPIGSPGSTGAPQTTNPAPSLIDQIWEKIQDLWKNLTGGGKKVE